MTNPPERPSNLLANVLVPVAHETDARKTAKSLRHINPTRVTALHVIEKGEGVPDKTPVEQSEEVAEKSFAAVRDVFPGAKGHIVYRRDVVEAIFDAAAELNASAIVFRSRGGNRLMHLLSGDLALRLANEDDRPVIALPRTDPDKGDG
jgi:nucleotide-binding universal stress UspA family protein